MSKRFVFSHHRRASVLVLLALSIFVVLALGALIVDMGVARWQRTRLEGAADGAAVEGLRNGREAAREFAELSLDRDWETEDGTEWRLELNVENRSTGDLVSGLYLLDKTHRETSIGQREDFQTETSQPNAFLVRMRQTNLASESTEAGVAYNAGSIPYVFGQVVSRDVTNRDAGISTRATSIARWNRALAVGRPHPEYAMPGVAAVAISRETWAGLAPGVAVEFQASDSGPVRAIRPVPLSVGQSIVAALPFDNELSTESRMAYVPITFQPPANAAALPRIIGFGKITIRRVGTLGNALPVKVEITRSADRRARQNATVALTGSMPAMGETDLAAFLNAFQVLEDGLQAPGLVRAESR